MGDADPRVVGRRDVGNGAEELERVDVQADPGRQVLGQYRLGIGVVARPQGGDEEIGRGDGSRRRIVDRDRIAGEVDEELFSRLVVLPEGNIQCLQPCPVAETELAVLVALRITLPVLMPQELEGDVLSPD